MGKGKDFRPSRRRGGFDDDVMPSFDMPRERSGRSFGGPPPFENASPSGPVVDATVSWFNPEKGFGFTSLADGSGDAFLHIGQLQAIGRDTVPPGTTLKVQVAQGAKGKQVVKVLEVDESTAQPQQFRPRSSGPRPGGAFGGASRPPRHTADPSTATPLDGAVKWFNVDKGFGFIAGDDGGKDVFVHISVLQAAGISTLADGQRVSMRVVETPKGREAVELSSLS